jgi:ATP-dependent RNA helicase DDX56/DBP9
MQVIEPLEVNREDVNKFKYRCNDMKRSVTGVLVKDARLREVKRELLNSEKVRVSVSVCVSMCVCV